MRDFTQAKDRISGKISDSLSVCYVRRPLLSTAPFKSTQGCMIRKSRTLVTGRDVTKHFLKFQTSSGTREFTQENDPTFAGFAIRDFPQGRI